MSEAKQFSKDITVKNIIHIGKLLSDIRKTENMPQTRLAKKMGKEQSFVSNAEKTVKIPSMPTIVNYLDKLGYKITIQKK